MAIYVVSEQSGLDGFWVSDILKGIKSEADKKNLPIREIFLPDDSADTKDEDIVLAVGHTRGWLEQAAYRIKRGGMRAIVVNADPTSGISNASAFVCFDYSAAMAELADYLKYCGKIRVAFVGCGGRLSFESKRRAFEEAAGERGLHYKTYRFPNISEMVPALVREHNSFDAVVCSRDAEAFHLISAFKKRRIFVPDDMYVVGIGGDTMSAAAAPSITTIHTDFQKLGTAAVKVQRFLSQNLEDGSAVVKIQCPLIIRGTTENKTAPHNHEAPATRRTGYRVDNDYLNYLSAEQLVRNCDSTDRSILLHLSKGKNMAEIAEELFISQSSVKYRVKKMLCVANIADRRGLIKIAQIYGLL